jgi:hypothetical protein
MRKQTFIFLLLTLLFTLSGFTLAHKEYKCVHDEKNMGPDQPDVKLSRFERRMRQSVRLFDAPIKIHLDSSNLDSVGQEREFILKIMSRR